STLHPVTFIEGMARRGTRTTDITDALGGSIGRHTLPRAGCGGEGISGGGLPSAQALPAGSRIDGIHEEAPRLEARVLLQPGCPRNRVLEAAQWRAHTPR